MNNAPVTSTTNSQGNGNLADLPLDELMRQIKTSANGLSQSDAKSRLSQYGYNELAEKKVSPLMKFLSYFWGAIPSMIEAAVIFSAAVGDWADFIIISLLLIGPFWSIPPAKPLAIATGISVAISSLLAIFGFFGLIQPIGLGWAIFNWIYCFVWLLIIDRAKLAVYDLFNSRRVYMVYG